MITRRAWMHKLSADGRALMAYFTRKVNRVVSFNGFPGLTTIDGKFV